MVLPQSVLRPATRADLLGYAAEVAPTLLGGVLRVATSEGAVAVRITEVEAYHGQGTGDIADPGSHARMGRTDRNATMWGEPGHLYVYLSHGIHSCVNVAAGPEGRGDGMLLRAGEVIEGVDLARQRRSLPGPDGMRTPRDRDLARGPGRLGQAVGLRHPRHDGIDAITHGEQDGAIAELFLRAQPLIEFSQGPRVGVAGVAGTSAFPWRFWITDDPTVSPFRPGRGAVEPQRGSGTAGFIADRST